MTEDRTLLRLRNAEKIYRKRRVLFVDDFALCSGDRILLSGSNGSGKSTFLRVLAGVSPLSRGEIERTERFRDMRIGVVPQFGGLYEDLTVRENFRVICHLYGVGPEQDLGKIWFIQDMGLEPFLDMHVTQLSGGYRKMAALASVLLMKPEGLLLDEPTSDLDDYHTGLIYDRLEHLSEDLEFLVIAAHEAMPPDFLRRRIQMVKGGLR